MTVDELHDQRDGLQILDVREQAEWERGHIAGSVHLPYHDIEGVPDGIDADRPVAAICGSGQRSAVAIGLLELHGVERPVHVVDGGVGTWAKRGWPVQT
jgi:rhodanese-related sulfurtransferase